MNGQKLFQEIIETVEGGGTVRIDGNLVTIVNSDEWKDDPENEVLYFGWEEEGQEYSEQLTEDDLNNATIDNGDIVIPDAPDEQDGVYFDRDIRISLYRKYEVKG